MLAGATPAARQDQIRILVVSADPSFRNRLLKEIGNSEISVEEAVSGAHALARLRSLSFNTLILDRQLPDLNAEEVMDLVRRRFPGVQVQLVDAPGREELLDSSPLVETDLSFQPVPPVKNPLASEVDSLPGMVGQGRAMQRVYKLARLVAARNTTTLITGETGTGKELVARAIHEISRRNKCPLVVVNCAAIPEPLLEAELFGHVRGAFTGAIHSRLGRIHNAHGGTLFLDEIGDLPLGMQSKLLRFLQDGEVQRLGSSDVFRVDVRVICATNVRLIDCVKQRTFRHDLYYRVAVFPIELPPLRERSEDIGPLAESFLADLCREAGVAPKRLSASAIALLRQSHWPGNVRELHHAVERAFILSGQESHLHVEHFSSTAEPAEIRKL